MIFVHYSPCLTHLRSKQNKQHIVAQPAAAKIHSCTCHKKEVRLLPKSQVLGQNQNFSGSDKKLFGQNQNISDSDRKNLTNIKNFKAATRNYSGDTNCLSKIDAKCRKSFEDLR